MSNLAAVGPQGRWRAKETVCLANLSRWHAVFEDYIAQNDGAFFTGLSSRGYWWPVQLDEATQSWKTNRTWFCPTATRPMIDEHGNPAPQFDIFGAWGIYHHPQLGPDGISGSYSLNGYTLAIPEQVTYEGGVSARDGWRDLGSVADADSVPLFIDALRFDLWPLPTDSPAANEMMVWSTSDITGCCINRHGGAVNCLFVDGAARKVGLKALWTLKWHRSFNSEGPWTMAGGVLPSDWPPWMREFNDY
jgi:prepilin-type processing-associated H-X9-DG protein